MNLQGIRSGLSQLIDAAESALPERVVELSDKSIHGEYIGVSPIAASQGASFEEATREFSIDHDGIVIRAPINDDTGKYIFRVCYSPEWIFHLKNWGVDGCLAVRQRTGSELAQFILSFPHRFLFAKHDAVMILGEGMPAVLGVFVRKEKDREPLRQIYRESYQPAAPDSPDEWLKEWRPLNPSDSVAIRMKVVEDAGHNLWCGSEKDVAKRLELIKQCLDDPSSEVQCEALSVFTLGGRVTGGVDLVVQMLNRPNIPGSVLNQAIDAAACLLYEAHQHTKNRAYLVRRFGSADIGDIYERSKCDGAMGSVTPDEMELIEETTRVVPAHRMWTTEHVAKLRKALIQIFQRHGARLPAQAAQRAFRALADYAL